MARLALQLAAVLLVHRVHVGACQRFWVAIAAGRGRRTVIAGVGNINGHCLSSVVALNTARICHVHLITGMAIHASHPGLPEVDISLNTLILA
jgi:hypothetical protein